MRRILRWSRGNWFGLLALGLAFGGGGYAAVAQVKLGRTNEAAKPTIFRNTGNGPALDLKSKAGSPSIRVNSNQLVPKLNASLLQGKKAADFAPATGSPSYAPATGSPNYAPAGGSPNYIASGGRQVVLSAATPMNTYLGPMATSGTVIDTTVTAPGNGTLVMTIGGYCTGVTTVDVQVGAVTQPFVPYTEQCTGAIEAPVTPGLDVTVKVTWTAGVPTKWPLIGTVVVYEPGPPPPSAGGEEEVR